MNLTSLARVKIALGISKDVEDGTLLRLIATASNRIAKWLKRENALQLTSRTEYHSPSVGQAAIQLLAYPISSVTSVYTDSTGAWDGSQVLVPSSDYIISEDGRRIIFINGILFSNPTRPNSQFATFPKSVRVIYTGGLAASGTESSWVKSTDTGGTLAVGNYIKGETSSALGLIKARASTTITYECLYGIFEAGETITEYSDITVTGGGFCEPTGATEVTATLTSSTSVSLAETYTDLTTACEMHVSYYRRNKESFENINVLQDGVTRSSRSDLQKDYFSLPETRDLLDTYKNKVML